MRSLSVLSRSLQRRTNRWLLFCLYVMRGFNQCGCTSDPSQFKHGGRRSSGSALAASTGPRSVRHPCEFIYRVREHVRYDHRPKLGNLGTSGTGGSCAAAPTAEATRRQWVRNTFSDHGKLLESITTLCATCA